MRHSNKVVPVIIMTRNESKYIKECVASLLEAKSPNRLIVVDNASTDQQHIDALTRLSESPDIHVIWCDGNRWVNNLDYAFACIEAWGLDFDFFALTDGDTVVSKLGGDWLGTLVRQMSENLWLGKLGASIDLSNIENIEIMSKIHEAERQYYKRMIAPGVYLAPVDTTLALYRKDVFVYKALKLRPGHMSAIRPYYHVGRSAKVKIVHRGWEDYTTGGIGIDKVKAFCKFGAHIQWEHFSGTAFQKFYYRIVSNLYRVYWGGGLGWAHLSYMASSRLFRQNRLYEQSKSRGSK
jgi:glycosyltransferase involved in cell wall biosynthesis